MPIDAKHFFSRSDKSWSPWVPTSVASNILPDCTGVYQFKNMLTGEIVYIGKAGGLAGLRGRIVCHLTERGNEHIRKNKSILLMRWRLSAIPEWREADLLRSFDPVYNDLPAYNERYEYAPLKQERRSFLGWIGYASFNLLVNSLSCVPTGIKHRKDKIKRWKRKSIVK
jgi:hypothetical protein